MARVLSFPARDDTSQWDVPVWITFYSANYSTWASKRVPSQIASYPNNIIALPYPTTFNTLNSIPYKNAPSIQMRGIEKMLRGGQRDEAKAATEGGQQAAEEPSLLGLAAENAKASNELLESFMTGGNVFRFDHTETVLEPGCRRVHRFEFNLVAKTLNSAKMASKIALCFQASAHPGNFTKSIYTMNHPDIWIFGISDTIGDFNPNLDGFGLTSVLRGVDINRSPIQNLPYTLSDSATISSAGPSALKYPLAINIKLEFQELEPALNWGVYEDYDTLAIRSQKDF